MYHVIDKCYKYIWTILDQEEQMSTAGSQHNGENLKNCSRYFVYDDYNQKICLPVTM